MDQSAWGPMSVIHDDGTIENTSRLSTVGGSKVLITPYYQSSISDVLQDSLQMTRYYGDLSIGPLGLCQDKIW